MSENETSASAPAKAAKESNIETVTMSDGRIVDFAGKRKLLKESIVAEDGSGVKVRFDFRNGQTRTVNVTKESSLCMKFAGHGVEQKIGDETAGLDDVDDAVEAVDELLERLGKGEWTMRAEGGGFAGSSVLLRALVEYSGKSTEQIKEFLKGMSQAEKIGLRSDPEIKPIVERLEAEKAAKGSKVDTKALLGKLGTVAAQPATA